MDWYRNFNLVEDSAGYSVVIQLNTDETEFSEELVTNIKKNILKLDKQISKLVDENFSDIKINSVKLMVGALVVGTIPFAALGNVHAAGTTSGSQQTVSQSYTKRTGTVSATKLNVRNGPSTNYSTIHKLWQGNSVTIIGESSGWYKIQLSNGVIGWVSKEYVKLNAGITSREQKVNLLISSAKNLVGTPYVWGGSALKDGGFDCSGFTQFLYKKVGYNLNRVSVDQAKQGVYVSRNNLQAGDLVFYSLAGDGRISHVGIYLGGGNMIHSPKTGDTVKITNITTGFWESRYVTSRRIIQ